ncbi:hypothetical protein ABIC15_001519 [Exiguobacterium sp. PvP048]
MQWTPSCRNSGGLVVLDCIEMQDRMIEAIDLYNQAKGIQQ